MSSGLPQIDILLYIVLSEEFNDLSDRLIEELGDALVPHELADIAITDNSINYIKGKNRGASCTA